MSGLEGRPDVDAFVVGVHGTHDGVAAARVVLCGADHEHVVGREVAQGDAAALGGAGIQLATVQGDRRDLPDAVDEG